MTTCLLLLLALLGEPQSTAPQAPPPQETALKPTQEVTSEQAEGNAIDVGPAKLRIGGYVGVSGIFRSTNSGGGPGTSFASIPYEDRLQGNVSETRLTAQPTRLTLRVDSDFPEDDTRFRRLSGYFEMDFGGSTAGNVAVTATSSGMRLRHAFAEAQYGESFYLAAGQAFTLMTPAKNQLSIWPADYELPQAVDVNYLAGTVWARFPQVRLSWRPSTQVNWALSIENPEQQLGSLVTLPACCKSDIDAQYNTGSDQLNVPNLMPDFVTRVAFNPNQAVHVDAGGVLRAFRHSLAPYDDSITKYGGGASINGRVNATAATAIIGQWASGSGLGRYIGGMVPDATFGSDGSIHPLGTASWVAGVEQKASARVSFAGYYSGVTIDEGTEVDTTGAFIGYGFPGSPNSHNKSITEITGTVAYLAARTTNRGSVQVNVQTSWLTREPWSQGAGPESARAFMFFTQVRYNLP